jgi:hypothetical protein
MVAHINSVGGAGVGSVATGVSMAESGANDLTIDGPQAVAEAFEVGIERAESLSEGAVEVEDDGAKCHATKQGRR